MEAHMASQWRQVQHNLQQEKVDISRFLAEHEHDYEEAHVRSSHGAARKVHFSLSLDEETLGILKKDAAIQGISPQDLVRWLLDQYADGQLTPKHFPLI